MNGLVSMLALGLVLGVRHATDADHVVAVATIASRERRIWASTAIGALWGVGHSLTLLVVGGAIVVFRLAVPRSASAAMELAVALMLIVLGLGSALGASRAMVPHGHGRVGLTTAAGAGVHAERRVPNRTTVRPVVVGVVHGLAGSGAIALLVLSAIPTVGWALGYLAIFGLGTVLGMAFLTSAVALPFVYSAQRFERLNVWLARGTGFASVATGLLVAYQVLAPSWTGASSP